MAHAEQLITRITPALSARLIAIAASSGQTVSELVRACIAESIDAVEVIARQMATTRERRRAEASTVAIDDACRAILRQLYRNETIVVQCPDLLSTRSLALSRIMSAIWCNDPDGPPFRADLRSILLTQFGVKEDAFGGEPPPAASPPVPYLFTAARVLKTSAEKVAKIGAYHSETKSSVMNAAILAFEQLPVSERQRFVNLAHEVFERERQALRHRPTDPPSA